MDSISPTAMAILGQLPSLARSAYSLAASALSASLSLLVLASTLAMSVLRLALAPVGWAAGLAFTLASPVIYTLAYVVSPFWYFAAFLAQLQPLYIYLGSAAFVGVVAGVSIRLSSNIFVVLLDLDRKEIARAVESPAPRSKQKASKQKQLAPPPTATPTSLTPPGHTTSGGAKRRGDYFGDKISPDIDWQVIDRLEGRGLHSDEQTRSMPLLQSIILEEEDDSWSGGD